MSNSPKSKAERRWRNMELLDHLAFNHFEHHSELRGKEAKAAWKALSPDEREEWHERMLASMEVYEAMSKEEQADHNKNSLNETLAKNDRAFNADLARRNP
jgi:hypothetical protein